MTRLLLVEDEMKLGSTLEEGLERAHYAVDLARDGVTALDFARVGTYDAIVLDVMLPKLSGLEVCRRLRTDGVRTPILMLTARDAIRDRIDGLDSGADDYLVKPFAFGELLARIRALLRRDAPTKDPTLRVSDLALDPVGTAHRLAGSTGGPDGSRVPDDRNADASAWLDCEPRRADRKRLGLRLHRHVELGGSVHQPDPWKLGEIGAPPLIQTVRGAGYRLRAPGT